MSETIAVSGFEMHAAGESLRPAQRVITEVAEDEVVVEVAGCGLCHTDIGFLYGGVRTRQPLPLILGHEISGVVKTAGAGCQHLLGEPVVVPAVIPCGACGDCLAGRPMICSTQVMPGNDRDGGFATHVVVPGRGLCPVPGASADPDALLPGPSGLTLRHLAVIADAISTPYAALERSGLGEDGLAIVIGLGGVGGYAAQLAKARGARVIGLDIDADKLARADDFGLDRAVNVRDVDARALKKQIRAWSNQWGVATRNQVVVECSGTASGQTLGFGLLTRGATLCVVGFTLDKLPLRLSNLMALDARAIGTWGCDPLLYPAVVDLVLEGRIQLGAHTELRPLGGIQDAFDQVRSHQAQRRLVLTP